ncbi:MAG: hypothetical protein ACM3SR_11615 [Ignavibacteriales bacterium]
MIKLKQITLLIFCSWVLLFLILIGCTTHLFMAYALANTDYTDYAQIPIRELVSDPGHYDDKKVRVEGEIKEVHYTTSSSGTPYTLFTLYDRDHNEVKVYYKSHLLISKGNQVRVMGKFSKEKRAALFLKFKNIIRANQVEKIEYR